MMFSAARLVLIPLVGGLFSRLANGAAEIDPHSLKFEEKTQPARVEFHFRLTEAEAVEGVAATAGGQKLAAKFTPFAEGPANTTAVLFLIDKSDPKRAKTIEAAKALTLRVIDRAGPEAKFAVYALASDLEPVAEFGTTKEEVRAKLPAVKALGMATELYRVSIAAIEKLESVEAGRKALVLLSDGRAEDTTFTIEQTVERAKEAGVAIFAVGYAESAQLTPHAQSLRRMAAETGGVFAEAEMGARREPESFVRDFFARLQSGGTATAEIGAWEPGGKIEWEVRTREQRSLKHEYRLSPAVAAVVPPVKRDRDRTWTYAAAGGGVLLIAAAVALLRRREAEPPADAPRHVYARLKLLDSAGAEHAMDTTAIRIGRGADNDIALRNDSISRHHAEIHRARDGSFSITDLGAGNGVLVNGRKVERTTLRHEDIIELGEVRLRFLIA